MPIEDVPATMITLVLLFIFIISMMSMYFNYFGDVSYMEQKRFSSSVAENIFFNSNGLIDDPDSVLSKYNGFDNIAINITNTETGQVFSVSNIDPESATRLAGSSMAITLYNATQDKYYPGRIDVYVAS